MDQDAAGDSSSASDSDSSESDYDDVETPSANPKPQYKVHQQQEPDASLAREQHDLSTTRSHGSVADTSAAIDPVSTAEEATVVTQQPQLLVAMGLSSDELQHVTQKGADYHNTLDVLKALVTDGNKPNASDYNSYDEERAVVRSALRSSSAAQRSLLVAPSSPARTVSAATCKLPRIPAAANSARRISSATLSNHSGGSNAYTGMDNTNYFFDVSPDHFESVLDRFTQSFREPLFDSSCSEREIKTADQYRKVADDFALCAFRSLGVVMSTDNQWKLLDLLPMFNPPRSDTAAIIAEAQWLGTSVKVLTGDTVEGASNAARSAANVVFLDKGISTIITLIKKLVKWQSTHDDNPPTSKDCDAFLKLQNVYRTRMLQDLAQFKQFIGETCKSAGVEGKVIDDVIETFVKHAGYLKLICGRSKKHHSGTQVFTVSSHHLDRVQPVLDSNPVSYGSVVPSSTLLKQTSKTAAPFTVFTKDLEISAQDNMCYRLVHLANGLEVLVIQEPKNKGMNVRDELLKSHNQYYSANVMKLVVPGREHLDQLTSWVQTFAKSVKDVCKLKIAFSIPDQGPHFRDKPGPLLPNKRMFPFKEKVYPADFYRNPLINITLATPIKTRMLIELISNSFIEYSYVALLAGLNYILDSQDQSLALSLSSYNGKIPVLARSILEKLTNSQIDPCCFELVQDCVKRSYQNFVVEEPYSQRRHSYAEDYDPVRR
ncbi:uncharacterized protein UHOD_11916 [Ustilago sp. UG-2017b]|nr:uncharacterized protein UHOD_11916 [Ustilago sp. UG-2017b]